MKKYDVLIIGAGIAGLYASMRLPDSMNVLLVCKDVPWECNTFYAQGGMATALDRDDVTVHVNDTIRAGVFHNNIEAVEIMSETSLETTADLLDRGMEFDKDTKENILYTKEAAHSVARIVHAGGDVTGRHMHYFMTAQNRHKLQQNTLVYDLLIDGDRCYGVKAMVNYTPETIYADNVIIASGGIGSLYALNTNSRTVSADIQGICVEKGIELLDMEFTQFHPTVYVDTLYARKLLLTEALRGEGSHIVGEDGERFLFDYSQKGELAGRDIVARGIFDYKRKTGKNAYLDFSMFDAKRFQQRFPNITDTFKRLGYDFPKDKVSVSPAFHYINGGISTDINGRVIGTDGLYAVGEAACTGVHGANRLASNSLLEGVVFAKRTVEHILGQKSYSQKAPTFDKDYDNILHKENDKHYKHKLREIMWKDVGIIRTKKGMLEAKNFIYDIKNREIGRLLELRLNTALAIINAALNRNESLGSHYLE